MRLSGLFPAVATPTTPQGAVDYQTLDRLCDFLLERGARGLCIGGRDVGVSAFRAGGAARDRAARGAARAARDHAGRRDRRDLGAARPRARSRRVRCRVSRGAAADADVLPVSADGSRDLLLVRVEHPRRSRVCSTICPAFTNPIEPETTLALLASEPHIVGLKDSSGHVENLLRFAEARGNRDWTLLIGDDRYGLASAEAGWDGAISGIACCCPELLVALHDSARTRRPRAGAALPGAGRRADHPPVGAADAVGRAGGAARARARHRPAAAAGSLGARRADRAHRSLAADVARHG